MLSAHDFMSHWKYSSLITFRPEAVSNLKINQASKSFLVEAGLPGDLHELQCILWQDIAPLTTVSGYSNIKFASYQVLGQRDTGGYLCLDQKSDGQIVRLQHENDFCQLVNSSVPQLAECLLVCRELIDDLFSDPSNLSPFSGYLPSGEYIETVFLTDPSLFNQRFTKELSRIDPKILQCPDSFWLMYMEP